MKRKRIHQYNEISEEVYTPKYWTRVRLILLGIFLLVMGFLLNFSLEEKINKFLESTLASNQACPIRFEKIEFSYFPPKMTMKKPVIQGDCFGQPQNQLDFKHLDIALSSPSFYPLGLRLHIKAASGKSYINLYPVISFFSLGIKIEKTIIDTQILAAMMENNLSPLSGLLSIEGFFEFHSGVIDNGQLEIASKNLSLPAQRISGFDITQLNLNVLNVTAHFSEPGIMTIDKIQLGNATAPLELSLNGKLSLQKNDFMNSNLALKGHLRLSEFMLTNFAFLKLFLPENKTGGNYQMKINGPLRSPGAPQFF